MKKILGKTIDHLRSDIDKVDKPQLKAMFETAAEVPAGLQTAFTDYERKNESAWKTESALTRYSASRKSSTCCAPVPIASLG